MPFTTLTINKSSYPYPLTSAENWGQVASTAAQALAINSNIDNLRIIWVGKHGSDASSGFTNAKAKLTFTAAIALAGTLTPTSANPVLIKCDDAGTYDEAIALTGNIHIYAPNATFKDSLGSPAFIVSGDSSVNVHKIDGAGLSTTSAVSVTGGTLTINANYITVGTINSIGISGAGNVRGFVYEMEAAQFIGAATGTCDLVVYNISGLIDQSTGGQFKILAFNSTATIAGAVVIDEVGYLSTVSTDGVSLSGDGSAGSPLSVVNWADIALNTAHRGIVAGNPHGTTAADVAAIPTAEKGVALGVATLDGSGKIPVSELPSAIFIYKGTWDASTNTPALADGSGTSGWLYRVSVAGTQDLGSGPITFGIGDYVIYNGATWEKSDSTDSVVSVNGYTGTVVLTKTDLSLGNVTNDAQLKRAAGDINSFTSKSPIADADIALIEDSADSFNKKKVTVDVLTALLVKLAGRAGGQTIQGGTAAGETLTLESTSNVSKGEIIVKDDLVFGATGQVLIKQGTTADALKLKSGSSSAYADIEAVSSSGSGEGRIRFQNGVSLRNYANTATMLNTMQDANGNHVSLETSAVYHTSEYDNGNSGTSKTIQWIGIQNSQKVTMTGNCTFTFTAPSGPCHLTLRMIQDGTGGRSVTWPATVKWGTAGEPTWNTTASYENYAFFYWNGTNYIGSGVVGVS